MLSCATILLVAQSWAKIVKKPPNAYLSGVKTRLRRIARWAVAAFCAACLAVFVHDVWSRWVDVEVAIAEALASPALMAAELALMAANLGVETLRWRSVRGIFTGGVAADDVAASLRAISLGNATPGNVGEHVGRCAAYADKRGAAVASVAASVLQTATIALLGMAACALLSSGGASVPTAAMRIGVAAFTAMCVVAAFAAAVLRKRVRPRAGWGGRLAAAALLNVSKVAVFSAQLFMLLRAGSDADSASLFAAVVFYYYLVTLTPRVNIIDLGVKGGLASYVLANGMCAEAAATSAVIIIWVINILLPSAIGFASMPLRRRVSQ